MRTPLANLKIARFDGQRLRNAGTVGTGFSETVAAALRTRLDAIRTQRCAVPGLRVGGRLVVAPDAGPVATIAAPAARPTMRARLKAEALRLAKRWISGLE